MGNGLYPLIIFMIGGEIESYVSDFGRRPIPALNLISAHNE